MTDTNTPAGHPMEGLAEFLRMMALAERMSPADAERWASAVEAAVQAAPVQAGEPLHRLLKVGETILADDEFYQPGEHDWIKVEATCGKKYASFQMVARRLYAAPQPAPPQPGEEPRMLTDEEVNAAYVAGGSPSDAIQQAFMSVNAGRTIPAGKGGDHA